MCNNRRDGLDGTKLNPGAFFGPHTYVVGEAGNPGDERTNTFPAGNDDS